MSFSALETSSGQSVYPATGQLCKCVPSQNAFLAFFIHSPAHRHAAWSVSQSVCLLVGFSVSLSVGRFLGQSVCWSVSRSVCLLVGFSVSLSVGRFSGQSVCWTVARSVCLLFGFSVSLSVGRSHQMTPHVNSEKRMDE